MLTYMDASVATTQMWLQPRPVGAINVGPKTEPPQEYDLVAFRRGSNRLCVAPFCTYASAPSKLWSCFNESWYAVDDSGQATPETLQALSRRTSHST
ncbi:hypothetical protein WJX77_008797 [Trebouxia sp. C0004]